MSRTRLFAFLSCINKKPSLGRQVDKQYLNIPIIRPHAEKLIIFKF